MTLTRRDMLSGAVFGAGSIVLYVYAAGFPIREGQAAAVSAGFYPKLLALILGILSAVQIVSALRAELRSNPQPQAGGHMAAVWKDRRSFGLFAVTIALLVGYPFLLSALGFVVAAFLYLVLLTFALSSGKRSGTQLWLLVALTLAITLVTYLVFRVFLRIPFPVGILGYR